MPLSFRILIFSCFSFAIIASTPELPKIIGRYYAPCRFSYGAHAGEVIIDRVAGTYEQWSRSCETTMRSSRGTIEAGNIMQRTLTAVGISQVYPPEWRPVEPRKNGSFEIVGNEVIEKNEDQQIIERYEIVED